MNKNPFQKWMWAKRPNDACRMVPTELVPVCPESSRDIIYHRDFRLTLLNGKTGLPDDDYNSDMQLIDMNIMFLSFVYPSFSYVFNRGFVMGVDVFEIDFSSPAFRDLLYIIGKLRIPWDNTRNVFGIQIPQPNEYTYIDGGVLQVNLQTKCGHTYLETRVSKEDPAILNSAYDFVEKTNLFHAVRDVIKMGIDFVTDNWGCATPPFYLFGIDDMGTYREECEALLEQLEHAKSEFYLKPTGDKNHTV